MKGSGSLLNFEHVKKNLWLSQISVSYKQAIIHNEWHNDFSHFLW